MIQAITACAFIHENGTLFAPMRASTKTFLPNTYELPGGHIELGEDIVVGLKREIREEFSMEIEVGDPFYVFTYINTTQNTHSIEVVYLATRIDRDAPVHINPRDHSTYQWVSENEALELWTVDDDERKAIIKGFTLLKHRGAHE